MKDLISREAALEICRRYWHPTYNWIMEGIEQLPSEEPEIIRCNDCKFGDFYTDRKGNRHYHCIIKGIGERHEDDYCSRAERRKNG